MAFASEFYNGNGVDTEFTIPFPYISQDHIKVSVNGVDLTPTTDYTFLSASVVKTTVAPANGTTVGIRRETPNTTRIVNFQDGSILDEATLDQDADQLLFIAQEGFDVAEGSLRLAADNTFDATTHRIKNVVDPVNAQDAATKAYGDANWGGAAATNAATSASQAATSATNASNSASAAAASAVAADASAVAAAASEANILTLMPTKVDKTASTGSAVLPVGTTAQRDGTPVDGYIRFNSTLNQFEGYKGGAWGAIGAGATGGVGNAVFYENDQTVSVDYTITSGKNAMTAGPVTINTGITVTVPTGSVWTVV